MRPRHKSVDQGPRLSITTTKMASNYDNKTKMLEKYKFQGTAGKAEVHISSGALGMEFFLEKTLPQFNQAGTRLDWT